MAEYLKKGRGLGASHNGPMIVHITVFHINVLRILQIRAGQKEKTQCPGRVFRKGSTEKDRA